MQVSCFSANTSSFKPSILATLIFFYSLYFLIIWYIFSLYLINKRRLHYFIYISNALGSHTSFKHLFNIVNINIFISMTQRCSFFITYKNKNKGIYAYMCIHTKW